MAAQGPIDHTVDDPEALDSCDRGCGPTFLEPCTYCGVTFCEACYAIGIVTYLIVCADGEWPAGQYMLKHLTKAVDIGAACVQPPCSRIPQL